MKETCMAKRCKQSFASYLVWVSFFVVFGLCNETEFKLKRVLFLYSAHNLKDATAYRSRLITEDSDAIAVICTQSSDYDSVLERYEICLPCFLQSSPCNCDQQWRGRHERVFLAEGSHSDGLEIYRAYGCTNDTPESILLLAAASKQRYVFYIPVNSSSLENFYDLPPSLPTRYANRQFRREMAKFTFNSVIQRLRVLMGMGKWQGSGESESVLAEGHAPHGVNEGRGGSWKKRFVYLLTGQSERDFQDIEHMAGDDADVILCVWGEPEDSRAKHCWEECTGDWPTVCNQVCVLPPTVPTSPVTFIYVRGSSFQQVRAASAPVRLLAPPHLVHARRSPQGRWQGLRCPTVTMSSTSAHTHCTGAVRCKRGGHAAGGARQGAWAILAAAHGAQRVALGSLT